MNKRWIFLSQFKCCPSWEKVSRGTKIDSYQHGQLFQKKYTISPPKLLLSLINIVTHKFQPNRQIIFFFFLVQSSTNFFLNVVFKKHEPFFLSNHKETLTICITKRDKAKCNSPKSLTRKKLSQVPTIHKISLVTTSTLN